MNLSNQNQRMVDAAREILEGKNTKELSEDYIEVMDPSLLHKAKQNILTAWEQWKRGPETERQDIKPAAAELKKEFENWLKKNIK